MNRTQTRFIVQHLLQICCAIVCRNCAHCSCVYNGFLSVDITHRILPLAPSVFYRFHVPSVSYGDPPSASHLFPFLSVPRGVFLVFHPPSVSYGDVLYGDVCPSAFHIFLSFPFFQLLSVPHGAFHVFHLPSVFYGDVLYGDACPSAFHHLFLSSFFFPFPFNSPWRFPRFPPPFRFLW